MTEYVRQRARYDSAVVIALSAARYCESLARPCLTVGEDGSVVAIKAGFNHVLHARAKNGFLLRHHIENSIEFELEVVFLHLVVS